MQANLNSKHPPPFTSLRAPPSKEDSIIQRLEYSIELFWKTVKGYLDTEKGIIVNSPKDCMRELRNIGILNEAEVETAIDMINDRNLSSHAYNEKLAEQIAEKAQSHAIFMETIFKQLSKTH